MKIRRYNDRIALGRRPRQAENVAYYIVVDFGRRSRQEETPAEGDARDATAHPPHRVDEERDSMATETEETTPSFTPIPGLTVPLVPSTPDVRLISGGSGTGKTARLLGHVAGLLANGIPATDILVLCATPDAAALFARTLAEREPHAADVRILTPRELELDLLGDPAAAACTGRDARLLAPFEMDFLMEDLKVSGLRPKRLREMVKFFFRGMTELADDDRKSWLFSSEEENVFSLLKACLGFMRGAAEPELANLCVAFLRADVRSRANLTRPYVVVDDYQLLSRASQMVANLLAGTSLTVACDPEGCIEAFESYPYRAGADELLAVNPHAAVERLETCYRSPAVAAAVNALYADEKLQAARLAARAAGEMGPGSVRAIASETPESEIRRIASTALEALEAGDAPGDLYIVTPHRAWTRNLERALSAAGVPHDTARSGRVASGDIRDLERARVPRLLTALYLSANPFDAVAWRSWCGFGDYLTRSNTFVVLRSAGTARSLALDAALEHAAERTASAAGDDAHASLDGVLALYSQGMKLARQACALKGDELLEFLARELYGTDASVPETVRALCAPFEDGALAGEDAAALAARARRRLDLPCFEKTGAVRIGEAARLVGLRPKTVLFAGFVNGFLPVRAYFDQSIMPLDKQAVQHERDVRLLAFSVGKAERDLVLSYFTETNIETAERLGLKIDRIRLKGGERVARLSPSIFLAPLQVAQT